MIVEKVLSGMATVTMSRADTKSLINALTIATLHVGPNMVVGDEQISTETAHMQVEYLRGVLSGLSERQ